MEKKFLHFCILGAKSGPSKPIKHIEDRTFTHKNKKLKILTNYRHESILYINIKATFTSQKF